MTLLIPLLLACAPAVLTCGPGTVERDGQCVPALGGADDGGADSGTAGDGDAGDGDAGDGDAGDGDSGATGDGDDTGSGVDTGAGGDTGETAPQARIWVLAGQSNMVGVGQVTSLPPDLRFAQDDVQLYWSGDPGWAPLAPASDYSDGSQTYFGPEVAFGRTMADARPDTQVYLVKHAVGGTDLASYWSPGDSADDGTQGEGYRTLMSTVREARNALEAEGLRPVTAGFVWMQGESDAADATAAAAYDEHLGRLVRRVRDDLDDPELPFVLGLIDCEGACAFREEVREAQQSVAADIPGVTAVETEDLGLYPTDPWHYQGIGQRVLGARLAQGLLGVGPEDLAAVPTPAIRWNGAYASGYVGDYVVGWRFRLEETVEVTDLGLLDVEGDGLDRSSEVAIWRSDSGGLVELATVPARNEGDTTSLDGFRTVGVAPFRLAPGDYVIGSQTFSSTRETYAYGASIRPGTGLTWVEGRYGVGSALALPTVVTAGSDSDASWFGASFRYLPVD